MSGFEETILFDTGGNGEMLLSNMRLMGLEAAAIDLVVLSHFHRDHVGGLGALLARNPDVTVYTPKSFPASFRREIARLGATVETISKPRRLVEGVYSTGEMGEAIKEQALLVEGSRGLVVITGCAHPNVVAVVQQAEAYLGKNVHLLMGGFHLSAKSRTEIQSIIGRLKALGVEKVAPSHCTGDTAIRMFRAAWKADFIEGGLGAVIEVARGK